MAKFPTYKQGKKIESFENQLLTSTMRQKQHRFQKEQEEENERLILEQYKAFLLENNLNGYSVFKDLNPNQ